MILPTSVLVLLICFMPLSSQQSAPSYRGSWTATAGTQLLRGTWTGRLLAGRPNAARGTWELAGETGAILMRGTWSAEHAEHTWRGTFSARTRGRVFSGKWKADLQQAAAQTFEEMLQRTMEKEVTGAWESGASFGHWSLAR
jgi:hypothetical protein